MTLTTVHLEVMLHLGGAVLAGGLIGLERSYHGRPAGFRTHTLVCLASTLLMLVTVYQPMWFQPTDGQNVTIDPTRMVQGIMTGIGFLGAGVIFKEGLSVRGLTTAASIWITAAIGVLIGVGFFFAAIAATLLTLGTLGVFRQIELRMPTYQFAQHVVRFRRGDELPEPQLRELLKKHGFSVDTLSYRLEGDEHEVEYRMMLRTFDPANLNRLARTLTAMENVTGFRISPTGD
ncbi:MgtC/SapB family protein [Caldimonas sp. KR1-144]|uniref:MgtC/SapB family protein n=1 Tax=Caldimonas sp. KR1-144 TaxID=3400911 RepID=UPI003C0AFDBB